jgi:predicted RNase H-like nuclease (RuvC/YqgF family)
MWRQLYDYARQLLTLKVQTEKNAADIKEMRQELKDLTAVVQRLAFEVQRLRDNEVHEREKMALRLENALLRFERRLPPAPPQDDNPE